MSHGPGSRTASVRIDDATAQQIADAMHALAAPSRVRILSCLLEAPHSVGDLAAAVSMEQSAVSHQLCLLRHLGLVVSQRVGRRKIYALHDSHVGVLLAEAAYHVEHVRLGYEEPVARAK